MQRGKIALERAQKVADAVVKRLSPFCQRIEIAGSIRRRKPWVNDVDLILIPHDLWNLHGELMKLGQPKMSGKKIMRVIVGSIQVDIYVADEATWATLLLIRTGSTENNIRLCSRAKEMGWHLAASGDGLFNERGERIAWQSEGEIFNALGLDYAPPERRE